MTQNLKRVNISVEMHPSYEYFPFFLIKKNGRLLQKVSKYDVNGQFTDASQ